MTATPRLRNRHTERHRLSRVGWLRAAVLGANDGIISTASLMVGVAAAAADPRTLLLTGVAGLTAGALSMAAGEYVSVSSQADLERADLAKERQELVDDPEGEHRELAGIWRQRGLSRELADRVATELTAHDALQAHARDELGLTDTAQARPTQAALASAASFAVGALVPLATALVAPGQTAAYAIFGSAFVALLILGAVGARTGGAAMGPAVLRVGLLGAAAMAVTAVVGRLFGAAV